jgi:hypothetical protein
MSTLRGLSLTLVVLMPQVALAADVCEGQYAAAVNGASPPVQGKVTGVPNPYRRQEVRIEVQDCGRTLLIHGDGAMPVTQSANDPTHYVGSAPGMTAVFDVWSPDRLTGQVLMPGVDGSVIYEMTLVDGHAPDMEGCGVPATNEPVDDDRLTVDPALRSEVIGIVADEVGVPRDAAGRYISAARTVAKMRSRNEEPTVILPGEGDCPAIFGGVRNCLEYPSETTTIVEVNLLLDADGRLLPITTEGTSTNRVKVDDPGAGDFCAQETTMPPAESRLRFKFFAIEDDGINDVQAVLADADTNSAQTASYVDGYDPGRQVRADGASEAYQNIGAPVTALY